MRRVAKLGLRDQNTPARPTMPDPSHIAQARQARNPREALNAMTAPILLCTVGGSHQPILTAIRERRPAFVLFFCTDKDPGTGRPGSLATITGNGTPIEVRRGAEVIERLPNIPTLASLAANGFDTCIVPPDDLDGAVAKMLETIADLGRRFPEAPLVADYTGGTKTMTAALVIAALESDGVELQLVTGARADLVKVFDGSQSGLTVSAEGIRLRRAMAPYLAAWQRFAFGEAADGRFDHVAALGQLDVYRPRLGAAGAPWFTALKVLTAGPADLRRTPARLWDLWLNAQRRAAQCRYDDAVARGYRLLEWTAQWLLATLEIDTSDLREDQIPAGVHIRPGPDGKRQAALRNAWELTAHHLGGEVRRFVETERSHLLDHLRKRNYSILAHGDLPIARSDWEGFSAWIPLRA